VLWRAVPVIAVIAMLAPVTLNALGERSRAADTAAAVAAHLARARATSDAGSFEAAMAALEAAHALAPADPAVQRAAMRVAVTRAAQRPSLVDDAELDRLDYALTALAEDGGPAVPASTRLVATGLLAERRGDAVQALARYEEAVKTAPADAYAHLAVARLQRRAGRRVEALAAFEAAVEAGPNNLAARNNLGVLYAELGRVDDAVAAFQAAIAVEDNVASRTNLATTLAGAERLEEAVEHMQRAIALAPGSAEAYLRLGQLLTLTGRHADAEAALTRSLELKNDPATGVALGRLYQLEGLHDRAVAVLSAVLEAKRDAFDAAYLLGVSLRAQGRDADAATAFRIYLSAAERIPSEGGRVADVRELLAAAAAPAPADPRASDATP
jgi:tetratricopeptide (TPR) repeat protein